MIEERGSVTSPSPPHESAARLAPHDTIKRIKSNAHVEAFARVVLLCEASWCGSALPSFLLVIRGDEAVSDRLDQWLRQLETAAFAVSAETFMKPGVKNHALCCG